MKHLEPKFGKQREFLKIYSICCICNHFSEFWYKHFVTSQAFKRGEGYTANQFRHNPSSCHIHWQTL